MAMILDKQVMDPTLDVLTEPKGDPSCVGAQAQEAEMTGLEKTQVATTRFGTLQVEPDLIITFSDGLIGFETCRRYIVVRQDENNAFRWLQSLEEPAVAFPIIEPGLFRPDYAPTISDADVRALELDKDTPTLVFVIVTVPPNNPRDMTANLLGPLVINGLTHKGKQVIVQDEGYTTRHRVMDELLQRVTGSAQPDAIVPAPPAKEPAARAKSATRAA